MSVAKATPTVTFIDNTQKIQHIFGTLAVGASPLTYATGGITCDFSDIAEIESGLAPIRVDVSSQPAVASAASAKYIYQFLPGSAINNGVLQIFETGSVTPAGTVSAPTITTTTNAGTTAPLYTNSGALTQTTGATGIAGVQAPTFTGSATTAAALAELASGAIPAGVSGDTIAFHAYFQRL